MQEYEFDKTRKAIKIDRLNEEEKKQLLEKFKQKGGKVLKEKAITKEVPHLKEGKEKTSFREEKKFDFREDRRPSQVFKEQKLKEAEKIAREREEKETILKKATSRFSLWTLKLELWFKKITSFKGNFYTSEFLSFLNLEFKKAILELNILTVECFSESKFLERFKTKFPPICLELLKRVYLLYDRKQLSDLTSNPSDDTRVIVDALRIPLFHFLKCLYVLDSFKELTLKTLLESIDILESLQKKPPEIYRNKKRRIQESWKYLMYIALPRFILLAQHLERKKIKPFTTFFEEEILSLSSKEKIDITKYQDYSSVSLEDIIKPEKKESIDQKQEKTEEKPLDPEEEKKQQMIEKTYHYGLKFLNLYSIEELRNRYDPKNEFREIPIYDKVFIVFLYFCFFDDQFSFLFLTNKLQLNTFFKNDVKVNLKHEMSLLYEEFRKIYDSFRKYYSDYLEYKKTKEEAIDKKSIDYQKKLDFFENRRISSARETQKLILNYIKKCEKMLALLYKDIRENKQIVVNPDDIVELDYDDINKKIMNKKPIRDIIRDAYATSFAIVHKIESKELKLDTIEFSEEEYNLLFKI